MKPGPSPTTILLHRRAAERGRTRLDWLDSRHTFSFGEYHDPHYMGFRALRVINDDRVGPGGGFGSHPHRDMEIVSYVLEGAMEHRDSLGNGSVMRPGDVQRMTAGTGVVHSEWNHDPRQGVHFLQIWILPERKGLPPGYEQKSFGPELEGRLRRVASPDGADGSLLLHSDASIWAGRLAPGQRAEVPFPPGRHAWVQVARGSVVLGATVLEEGDGAALDEPGSSLVLTARSAAEVLVFDLA